MIRAEYTHFLVVETYVQSSILGRLVKQSVELYEIVPPLRRIGVGRETVL